MHFPKGFCQHSSHTVVEEGRELSTYLHTPSVPPSLLSNFYIQPCTFLPPHFPSPDLRERTPASWALGVVSCSSVPGTGCTLPVTS